MSRYCRFSTRGTPQTRERGQHQDAKHKTKHKTKNKTKNKTYEHEHDWARRLNQR